MHREGSGFGHPGNGFQGLGEFSGFHTEAADLYLVITPTAVGKTPIFPRTQVTGSIHSRSGLPIRIGDKSLRSQPWPAEISSSKHGTSKIEFANFSFGAGHKLIIQDSHAASANWFPD